MDDPEPMDASEAVDLLVAPDLSEPNEAAAPVNVAAVPATVIAPPTRRRRRSAGNGRTALDLSEPVQVAVPVNVAPAPSTRTHHRASKKTTGATVARVPVSISKLLMKNNLSIIRDVPRG